MHRQESGEQLRVTIEDFLAGAGLELVDFTCRHSGKDLILNILVDKPQGGITLDECAGLNKGIALALEEKAGLEQESYIMEVSSPGLDRPLKTKNDFFRCLNKAVRLFFNEQVDGKWELEGVITGVDDNFVYIDADNKAITVPLAKINKAKQIV